MKITNGVLKKMYRDKTIKNIVKDMSVKDLVNLVSSYLKEIKEYEDFIECLINDEDRRNKKISKLEDRLSEVVKEKEKVQRRMWGKTSRFNKKYEKLKNDLELNQRKYHLERIIRTG